MHIHWLDLDLVGDDGQQMDEKVIKRQIEKQMDQLNKQEAAQNENYKQKKEELMKHASNREKNIHAMFQQKLQESQEQMARDNNRGELEQVQDMSKTMTEFAIYDNGDSKTKNNQLVVKIEKNQILDDGEKERILQQHEGRMHNIDSVLDSEKQKQQQELDRALKERLDRRHRMREKIHGKDIRNEEAKVEQEASEKLEKAKEEAKQNLEQ